MFNFDEISWEFHDNFQNMGDIMDIRNIFGKTFEKLKIPGISEADWVIHYSIHFRLLNDQQSEGAVHLDSLPRRQRSSGVPAEDLMAIGKISNFYVFAKFCKFLAGSFSAVSKRNFARKYAFDSIFQALQDLHPFAPLQSQNFRKKSVWKNSNFREISAKKIANVAKFAKC